MELPIKVIVTVALLAFALATFYILFSRQSGESMSRTEANRVFYGICDEYRRENCDWAVRSRSDFARFMDSCAALFGAAGEYSCLYQHCCQETKDVLCSGLCHACRGGELGGAKNELCCARMRSECPGTECDACV